MKILAIESSCDETAAAVVEDLPAGRQAELTILGSAVATSAAMHEKYGGIVPEVAAREQLKCIIPTIEDALRQYKGNHAPARRQDGSIRQCISDDIDTLAITVGPGLIGSLLIGVETVKTIAMVTGKPIIPVNHVLAHMYANFVDSSSFIVHGKTKTYFSQPRTMNHEPINFPAVSLVVSGGHTELFLMKSEKDLKWLGGTLDDAAGEAFDKTARLLGFGSRGGVAIQESASKYQCINASIIKLPRPMLDENNFLNFSFSGLKTAILREVNKFKSNQQFNNVTIQQLSYEVQETITDVLVAKTLRAAEKYNAKSILISGGVASNLRLREKILTHNTQYSIHIPPIQLCTDNAVYIAAYAFFRGKPVDWHKITAVPDLSVEV